MSDSRSNCSQVWWPKEEFFIIHSMRKTQMIRIAIVDKQTLSLNNLAPRALVEKRPSDFA
jgi:hypothetical protein